MNRPEKTGSCPFLDLGILPQKIAQRKGSRACRFHVNFKESLKSSTVERLWCL